MIYIVSAGLWEQFTVGHYRQDGIVVQDSSGDTSWFAYLRFVPSTSPETPVTIR